MINSNSYRLENPPTLLFEKFLKKRLKSAMSAKDEIEKLVSECVKIVKGVNGKAVIECKRKEKTSRGKLFLNSDIEIKSPYLSKIGEFCDYGVIYLVTLGEEATDIMKKQSEKDMVFAYFLDMAFSSLLEAYSLEVYLKIKREAEEEKHSVSIRISPGNCDWDISGQNELFKTSLLKSSGVKLTDSSLMIPEKSTTGIFLIASEEYSKILRKGNCASCANIKNCEYVGESLNYL